MTTPSIDQLVVPERTSLREAIRVITESGQCIAFATDDDGVLVGVASDGDLRRALLRGVSLDSPLREAMNRRYVAQPYNAPREAVAKLLSNRVRHIPLLDEAGRPVDYACLHRLHRIPVLEPQLGGNELAYLGECVRSGWISSKGEFIRRFEQQFVDLSGVPHAIATSNGTVALHLALAALGIGPGDEVIVPDLTFAACPNAVLYTGATPVLVDVDADSWTMAPDAVEAAITPMTRAIMPVHLYGHPCDMDPLLKLAAAHRLLVVEDCAEALGARYRGRPVGTFGDAATYSFYGNKTITTGEGGMVLIRDPEVAARARRLRDHGMSTDRRYWHDEVGFNYRMTNLQAAIGVAQMERMDELVAAKRAMAARYDALLKGAADIERPTQAAWAQHSYWLYVIRLTPELAPLRDVLIERFLLNGIDTRPAFYPLHQMPPYRGFGDPSALGRSIDIAARGIGLPSSVTLGAAEQEQVAAALDRVVRTVQLAVEIGQG